MQQPPNSYPAYARSERIADGTLHAIGVIGAIAGATVLIIWTAGIAPAWQIAAISVYGATLVATFVASAMYHMTPWESLRPRLHRLDHAAIYLKIAGTYTPLVAMIGSWFAYVILGVVWGLALIGVVLNLFVWCKPGKSGPALYLIMGWLSLVLLWSLWPVVPTSTMVLIGIGGLLYTCGVPFFTAQRLKFAMAIWHGFVLAGSGCFFAAIALGIGAAA